MAWGNCIAKTTGWGCLKCVHSTLEIKEVWLKELWITWLDNSRLSKSSFLERLSWRYDLNIGGNKVTDSGKNQDVKSLKDSLTLNNFACVTHNFYKPFMHFIKKKIKPWRTEHSCRLVSLLVYIMPLITFTLNVSVCCTFPLRSSWHMKTENLWYTLFSVETKWNVQQH